MKGRDERKDKSVDKLTKLPLLYEKGRKRAAPAQVVHVVELRWRVTKLEGELEEKELQLQTLTGLEEKRETL